MKRLAPTQLLLSILAATSLHSVCAQAMDGDPKTDAGTSAEFVLSPIVLVDSTNQGSCAPAAAGDSCRVTWSQAVDSCKQKGGHLPTARDYANALKGSGTVTLEVLQVTGDAPAGYYLVASRNEDGSTDAFYMNHQGFRRTLSPSESHLLWTASTPPGHEPYAHVYYDEWGGGGGDPRDHLKAKLNSYQCILPR